MDLSYQASFMSVFLRGATELDRHVFVPCFSWDSFLVLKSNILFS